MSSIAIIRPGALGDIFCILPLVPLIRKVYSGISIYCADVNFAILNQFVLDNGPQLKIKFAPLSDLRAEDYDKVLTISGYPAHEGYPNQELRRHIIKNYALELGVSIEGDIPSPELASYPPPPELIGKSKIITIQTQTGWSRYKELGFSETVKLIDSIKKAAPDVHICHIGGPDHVPLPNVDSSFLGQPFENNVAAQSWADLHVGPDSIFNHTSNITWSHKGRKTKAIIYFGSTSPRGHGYFDNINIYRGLECQPCYRENPEISSQNTTPCPYEHKCLKNSLTSEEILSNILRNI